VIVPIFQQEKFVAEMIDSLLSQTLADIEIIVIDDGSTDRGGEIVQGFRDSRVLYTRRHNAGPSIASNDGVLQARGEFVALMGGDDIAEPWRLAHQIDIIRRCNLDMVFSAPALIDECGRKLNDAVIPSFYGHVAHRPASKVFRQLLVGGNFLCAPTAMLRRTVFSDVGLFRPELIQLQDYDFWLRASAIGKTISVMPHRTTRYRRHPGNLSAGSANDAMMGEMMLCIYRALVTAPGEMIVAAFPDLMPPGKVRASALDRAAVAMCHPFAAELSHFLTLNAFLDANGDHDGFAQIPMADLGRCVSAGPAARSAVLNSTREPQTREAAEQALWAPVAERRILT
jgi:GT2 family glycosyltransferase